jgi:cytochrome c oxidase subunit 4
VSAKPTTGTFVRVWAWLMGLALASFLLSFLHLGAWSTVVALGVGLTKAILIAAFFMELAQQPSISRWAFGFGIALTLLLLIMIGLDVATRDTFGLQQPGLGPATSTPDQPSTR